MSAKASPRKKKASRSTTQSRERAAPAVIADQTAEPGSDRADDAVSVAEHMIPPADLAPPAAAETPGVPSPESAEAVEPTPSLAVAASEPGPAPEAVEVATTVPEIETQLPLSQVAVDGSEPRLDAAAEGVAARSAQAALEVPGSETSSTQALQSIRRALPSREQAAAALRLLTLRQSLLSAIDLLLPTQGTILEVGCGPGLVTAYLAQTAPARTLIGVDSQPTQIQRAERLARDLGLTGTRYLLGDAQTAELPTDLAAIYAIDALHRLPAPAHEELLARLVARLQPGGVLVIKELTTASLLGTRVAELVDWTLNKTLSSVLGEPAATATSSEASYRHHEDWLAMLRRLGLKARAGLVPDLLQPHVLLTATRP